MEAIPNVRYRPLNLMGEHNAVIDDKSRLLIPAELRKGIFDVLEEKRLIIHVGRKRVARVYPDLYFKEMIFSKRQTMLTREQEEDFDEAFYGMAYKMEWDAQGRIVLPELLIERANLAREITIIGGGDYLVLRNRENWKTRSEELLGKIHEITDRERDNRDKQTTTQPPAQ